MGEPSELSGVCSDVLSLITVCGTRGVEITYAGGVPVTFVHDCGITRIARRPVSRRYLV